MKYKVTPNSKEKVMRENDFIVSKTDLKGLITYGNRIFVEFSGYDLSELIGAQHNIIRHPDMPRAVFKLLWDTIEKGKEISAYVKNMAKDGSFYWVFANVTPDFDEHGNIVGYYSVRRKPRPEAIKVVEGLYQAMFDAEQKAGARDAIAASTKVLTDLLAQKGVSYDELIFSL
jgi:PAS domain S-box-containing protein